MGGWAGICWGCAPYPYIPWDCCSAGAGCGVVYGEPDETDLLPAIQPIRTPTNTPIIIPIPIPMYISVPAIMTPSAPATSYINKKFMEKRFTVVLLTKVVDKQLDSVTFLYVQEFIRYRCDR